MKLKKLLLTYLASYLSLGGLGLLAAPELALKLLLSNGRYGDVMPRLAGMFMLLLGGMIWQFVRREDFSYFAYSLLARTFAVVAVVGMYFYSRDLLFITFTVIVLIGLLPSYYSLWRDSRPH